MVLPIKCFQTDRELCVSLFVNELHETKAAACRRNSADMSPNFIVEIYLEIIDEPIDLLREFLYSYHLRVINHDDVPGNPPCKRITLRLYHFNTLNQLFAMVYAIQRQRNIFVDMVIIDVLPPPPPPAWSVTVQTEPISGDIMQQSTSRDRRNYD